MTSILILVIVLNFNSQVF